MLNLYVCKLHGLYDSDVGDLVGVAESPQKIVELRRKYERLW
jgi:hypothetical protein